MEAAEARKIRDNYLRTGISIVFGDVDSKIKAAAERGCSVVSIDLDKIDFRIRDNAFNEQKKVWEAKGYIVQRDKYAGDHRDQRDSGHDHMNLSW